MKKEFYKLRCVSCGSIVPEKDSVSVCPACGEALNVEFDPAAFKKRIDKEFKKTAPISAQKYLPFFPLDKSARIVSLDEGGTPLIKIEKISRELKQPNLFIKHEGMNPTGVFKDRGSLVEISKALELKAKAVVVASTGNMAASVSAYSAIAGLPCYVLIPENTPLGKLAQAMSYGARILSIRGTYADCCRLAEEMAYKYNFYLAGDYVFRSEGQKTIAFEIVEQLGWRVPDVVVVPVGCGTNLAAIRKGFVEFKKLGFIKKLPKIIAVQPSGCSTVVAAFQNGLRKAPFVAHPETICSAVGIGRPLDDLKALAAIRDSGGSAVAVSDSDVAAAQKKLGEIEAIFVEPSAALSLAAVKRLRTKRILKKSDTVVLIATGAGLKDPKSILATHPTPPAVEPDISEVDRFLKYKLYAIRSAGFAERKKTLFKKLPTLARLRTTIKKEFAADLKNTHLAEIRSAIETFITKGKIVAKADLQNLVEEALGDLTYEKKVMRVRDYELQIQQKKRPSAKVVIEFQGKKLKAESRGVGPVDAVISAIRKALDQKSPLSEQLVDFEVFVDADGTDATTEVKMKLEDSRKNYVVATANSPDIITAAIAAFEKGYNILYWKGQKS
ncbi:MAG: threonine synthase [Candidatus Peribacteraceae bacterium]|nr:threonine synthase [Candidatus Peribacteraceae bacterium]